MSEIVALLGQLTNSNKYLSSEVSVLLPIQLGGKVPYQ